MPQFFINSKQARINKIFIEDSENYNHIVKSLRTKVGEKLLFIDENEIQYETIVEEITKTELVAKINNLYKSTRKLDYDLYVAFAPLNSSANITICEKLTELGVKGFYPIYTDNCAIKKDVVVKKIPKWQKICFEAFKQCERANIPKIYDLTTLKDVIELEFDKILCFVERDERYGLKEYFDENPIVKNEKVLVIIGPEGGFSKQEFEFFEQKALNMLSLGKLILKADTACVVAIGNIIYESSNS